jgi:hypothetical protein
MRRALLATAVMNLLAAPALLPAAAPLRALAGLPDGHPLYLMTVGLFIGLFGLGYLATGLAGRADRLFLALGAGGKLGFFALMTGFWLMGEVPARAELLASADLVFGGLFAAYLLGIGAEAEPVRAAAGIRAAGGR